MLKRLEALNQWFAKRGEDLPESVAKKVNYFQEHREHLHYQQVREEGCPMGSGSVESLANQFQHRFKRSGQFWLAEGLANLMALEVAKRNEDWDDIWLQE